MTTMSIHNEMTMKRTRRKKGEDHLCRCTIQMPHLELQSIYCRHALSYSYFILVFCLVFLTVAFLCVPMDEPAAIPSTGKKNTNDILAWHAAGWCPCGCCQPKWSSTLRHRRVFLDADSEGTRKAAEAIWCWQSEMPGVWPGSQRFCRYFSFSKHLFFFANLVRWEGSTKISIQRCYKKYCSLRFNKVFFQVCTSNFWRNWNLPRFRCGGPWYRYPGGDGRGELLRSVASANVYPSCGAHGTRREGMRRMLCGGKVEECCFSWYNFHAQQIGYQLGEGPKVEVVQMEGLRFFVAKHLNFSPLFSIYRFHCAWLILWWHEY